MDINFSTTHSKLNHGHSYLEKVWITPSIMNCLRDFVCEDADGVENGATNTTSFVLNKV